MSSYTGRPVDYYEFHNVAKLKANKHDLEKLNRDLSMNKTDITQTKILHSTLITMFSLFNKSLQTILDYFIIQSSPDPPTHNSK